MSEPTDRGLLLPPEIPKPTALRTVDKDWLRLSALADGPADLASDAGVPNPLFRNTGVEPATRETIVDSGPRIPGYEIQGVLGLGATGFVYKAQHVAQNRLVAIKILRGSGPELNRIRDAAAAIAAIQHPNIVPIYDVGECNGAAYVAMEFVEGGSLAQALAGRPQPPQAAAEAVQILALAIQAAHDRNIAHLDLKPGNVLIDGAGRLKISDFDLIKCRETELSRTESAPAQLPPNQTAAGTENCAQSDVYSLGAILYEMLTGQPPLATIETQTAGSQIGTGSTIPPRRLQPDIPSDLETICLKCLEKTPAQRYASASDLADDLQRFRDGKAILGRPTGLAQRSPRRQTQISLRIVVAVVVCLLFTLMIIYSFFFGVSRFLERMNWQAQVVAEKVKLEGILEVARIASNRDPARWPHVVAEARRVENLAASRQTPSALTSEVRSLVEQAERGERDARAFQLRLERNESFQRRAAEVRLSWPIVDDTPAGRTDALKILADLFRDCGIDVLVLSQDEAANRIQESEIRDDLTAALHEWMAILASRPDADTRLLSAVTELVDRCETDPWRRRLWVAIRGGDWTTAVSLSSELVTASQPSYVARLVAHGLGRSGFSDEALRILRQAQARAPGDFWINHELAWQFHHTVPPRLDEAIAFYRVAMALRSDLLPVWTNLAVALAERRQFDEAIRLLQHVVQKDPTRPNAHTNLGDVYSQKREFKDALNAYSQALLRDGEFAPAWRGIGAVLFEQGKYDEALDAFRSAVRLAHNQWQARCGIGDVLVKKRQLDAAITAYGEAVRVASNASQPHYLLGRAYALNSQYSLAVDSYRESLKHQPNSDECHVRLGLALAKLKCFNEAQASFQRAAELQPRNGHALAQLGRIWQQKGEWQRAELAFRDAVDASPRDSEVHFYYGLFLLNRGRIEEAVSQILWTARPPSVQNAKQHSK